MNAFDKYTEIMDEKAVQMWEQEKRFDEFLWQTRNKRVADYRETLLAKCAERRNSKPIHLPPVQIEDAPQHDSFSTHAQNIMAQYEQIHASWLGRVCRVWEMRPIHPYEKNN